MRLGTHCSLNSAGLTTILLATGLMDLRIMAAVTMAITFERLAPNGTLAARLIGGATSVSALILIAKALRDWVEASGSEKRRSATKAACSRAASLARAPPNPVVPWRHCRLAGSVEADLSQVMRRAVKAGGSLAGNDSSLASSTSSQASAGCIAMFRRLPAVAGPRAFKASSSRRSR